MFIIMTKNDARSPDENSISKSDFGSFTLSLLYIYNPSNITGIIDIIINSSFIFITNFILS